MATSRIVLLPCVKCILSFARRKGSSTILEVAVALPTLRHAPQCRPSVATDSVGPTAGFMTRVAQEAEAYNMLITAGQSRWTYAIGCIRAIRVQCLLHGAGPAQGESMASLGFRTDATDSGQGCTASLLVASVMRMSVSRGCSPAALQLCPGPPFTSEYKHLCASCIVCDLQVMSIEREPYLRGWWRR